MTEEEKALLDRARQRLKNKLGAHWMCYPIGDDNLSLISELLSLCESQQRELAQAHELLREILLYGETFERHDKIVALLGYDPT